MTLLKWRVYMHLRKQPTNTCTLYLFNLKWPCLTSNLYSPSFILHSVMEFRGTVWAPLPRRGWGQNTFPLVRPRRRDAIKLSRDFPHFAPRGEVICDHRMLYLMDFFAAEIYFSMMFTFSLVYARAFGNRQISSS